MSIPVNLLARNVDQIALPQQVFLFLFDSYRNSSHKCEDCSVDTELIDRNN